MRLKRKSDEEEYILIWPKILPTPEQMQENDMTGIFVTMRPVNPDQIDSELDQDASFHDEQIIYAPFAKNFDYEIINEEGDEPWTMQQ